MSLQKIVGVVPESGTRNSKVRADAHVKSWMSWQCCHVQIERMRKAMEGPQ